MALPLGHGNKFCNSAAYAQLVEAQHRQGPLPLPHMTSTRGLHAPIRTLRRAKLEQALTRANHGSLGA